MNGKVKWWKCICYPFILLSKPEFVSPLRLLCLASIKSSWSSFPTSCDWRLKRNAAESEEQSKAGSREENFLSRDWVFKCTFFETYEHFRFWNNRLKISTCNKNWTFKTLLTKTGFQEWNWTARKRNQRSCRICLFKIPTEGAVARSMTERRPPNERFLLQFLGFFFE